jgi:hypothetical protein
LVDAVSLQRAWLQGAVRDVVGIEGGVVSVPMRRWRDDIDILLVACSTRSSKGTNASVADVFH